MRINRLSSSLMIILGLSTYSIAIANPTEASKEHVTDTENTSQPIAELSKVVVTSSLSDVYLQPTAESYISSEQFQVHHNGNINQMIRDTPGSYTIEDPTNPGVSVNIRGLSGYGRVNTMIDGVPQTFKNAHGHAAYGGTRLYIQSELIGGVDVSRGAVSGADGSGALM